MKQKVKIHNCKYAIYLVPTGGICYPLDIRLRAVKIPQRPKRGRHPSWAWQKSRNRRKHLMYVISKSRQEIHSVPGGDNKDSDTEVCIYT